MEAPARVQALAQSNLSTVPSQYIQSPENRPRETSNINVPVIDLSSESWREQIGAACKNWGAFQVINHSVPIKLLSDMRNAGNTFFKELSIEEKIKYSCDPNSAASEGYGSRMLVKEDTVFDWRDYFDHHTLPLSRRNPNKWPQLYRDVVVEYSDQMRELAGWLLGLISESLGLPCKCIEDAIGEIYQNITIGYYPPCPQPDLTLGLQSHSDMGGITLLIQDDVGGLQVEKDGEWVTVHPISHAIVAILADQTEIITNGLYRSSQHRAITNSSKARVSVATFHDPAKSRKIHPASQLISKHSPARYRQVEYGDYVSSWYTRGPDGKRNIDALLIKGEENPFS